MKSSISRSAACLFTTRKRPPTRRLFGSKLLLDYWRAVYEVIRPGRGTSDYPSSSSFLNSNFTAKGSDYRKRDVRD